MIEQRLRPVSLRALEQRLRPVSLRALEQALLALVFAGLAACGRAEPEGASGRTELILWHAYRGEERAVLETLLQDYQRENPTVAVRALAVPYDAFVDKISMAIPRGNGPDLFIFAHDRLGDWAERGLLEPLGFLADEALADRFEPQTLAALLYRDELYGLPLAFKCLALYFDKRLVPTAPATTEDLIAAGRAARARDAEAWGIAWEVDSLYFHAPWLHGFGGAVYAAGTEAEVALGSPAAVRSVAFVRDLRDKEHLLPPEVTSALVTSLFRGGKLAFVVSGPWFRGELTGLDTWGVAPLPVVSETGLAARPFLGVEGLFLSRRSAVKAEAFALARVFTGDDAARRRFAEAAQLVANRAVYADAAVRDDAFAQAFRTQLANTVPLSNRPHMRRLWTPAKDALSAAILHGMEPEEALRRALEEIARATQ